MFSRDSLQRFQDCTEKSEEEAYETNAARQRKVNEHPLTKSKHATNLASMASLIDPYATKFHLDLLFFNDLSCAMVIASWSEAKIAGLGTTGGGKKARKAYALEKDRLTLVVVHLTAGFCFKAERSRRSRKPQTEIVLQGETEEQSFINLVCLFVLLNSRVFPAFGP